MSVPKPIFTSAQRAELFMSNAAWYLHMATEYIESALKEEALLSRDALMLDDARVEAEGAHSLVQRVIDGR